MSYEIKARAGNGMLFVEFEGLDGKRKRISLGTRDMKLAEKLGREKYVAHIRGEDKLDPSAGQENSDQPKAKPTMTLGMAIEKMKEDEWSQLNCKSWRSIWSDAGLLLNAIGDIEVADITYDTISEYVKEARAEGHASGTIKKRLSRLSKVLNNCARKWINPDTRLPYLTHVPAFPNPGKPNVRKAELTEEDERRVYDYCDQQQATSTRGHNWWLFKQFIMWQIDTGMRKGESLLVDFSRIKHDAVWLDDGETKNDEGRPIPLTTRLLKMVEVFHAMGHNGPLFSGLTFGKIQEMWNDTRLALGLGNITIHDLRHTRGQRLADAGTPLEVIAELLGHKDISVTAAVYTVRKLGTLRKWVDHAEENPGAGLKEATALRLVS